MTTDPATVDEYNQYAEEYGEHLRDPKKSIYHSLYEKPAMYGLLPGLDGKSALSIGCGTGEDCVALIERGAQEVVGIDISEGLIDIAANSYPQCTFQVMDMQQLDFPDYRFDLAFSSLTLHYVDDWSPVLRETFRVLKPGSCFVFSCFHPLRFNTESLAKGGYFRHWHTQRKLLGEQHKLNVTVWHKPLGDMAAQIGDAGFVLQQIVEPKPLPAMQTSNPRIYETLSNFPEFIIFKLYKPA